MIEPAVPGPTASTWSRRRATVALSVVCAVQFLDAMDIASMGPALPRIQAELGMTPTRLQWVVSGYVLAFGGFLLLGGRLADRLRRRRLLVFWSVVFAAASLAGGLAQTGELLIAARLLKGVSAAFTAPAALAILLDTYSDAHERSRALGAYLMIASVGFMVGLIGGGALASITWRLTLLLPALAAIAIAIAARFVIPDNGPSLAKRARPDVIGAITVTGGVLLLVFAVSRAATSGWTAPLTVGALLGGIALLILFVLVERIVQDPLVPLEIFGRPQLGAANICMLFQGCYVSFQFVTTLYYQDRLDWSPLQAGLAFLIGGVIVAVGASRFAAAAGHRGSWPFASLGLTLQLISYVWFVLGLGNLPIVPVLIVQQLAGGLGFAAAYPALNIAAVASATDEDQGLASGIFIAAVQVGSGLTVGVAAAVLTTFADNSLGGYRAGLWLIIAISLAICALGLTMQSRHRGSSKAGIGEHF